MAIEKPIRTHLVERAASLPDALLEDPDTPDLQPLTVLAAALAANDQHRFALAQRWADRAVALDRPGEAGAFALLQRGVASVHLGAARSGLDACQAGLDGLAPGTDPFLRAELTAQRGVCERRLGMPARALVSYQLALDAVEALDTAEARSLRGVLHNNKGILHQRQGDSESALAHFRRGIEVAETLDDPGLAAIQQHLNLGRILLGRDDLEGATRHLHRAVALATSAPEAVQARAWEALAHAELAAGDPSAAERALEPALVQWRPDKEPLMYAATRLTQARIKAARDEPEAEALLLEVERIATELGDLDLRTDVASELAAWNEQAGRFEEACAWHRAHRDRVAQQLDELRTRTVEELRLAHEMERREHDRSEALRSARDEALRADAAKTTFLARVSHELRTPLTGILGYTDLLLDTLKVEDQPDPTEIREDVLDIQRGGAQLLRLIDRLLQLTALASGEIEASHPVQLTRVLDGAVQRAAPLAESSKRSLRATVRPPLASTAIVVAELHVRAALDELVDNALRFGSGAVELIARLDGDRVEIEVRDEGPGLPEGGLDRWTEAFTQADPSPTRQHEGLGLGLSLARQHAERMHGALSSRVFPGGSALVLSWPSRMVDDTIPQLR